MCAGFEWLDGKCVGYNTVTQGPLLKRLDLWFKKRPPTGEGWFVFPQKMWKITKEKLSCSGQ